MFDWLKGKRKVTQPEARWNIGIEEAAIVVTDDAGTRRRIGKDDLSGVIIETNDSGPWGADVWWLLFGADDRVACAFPQGATGETLVIELLVGLPGFDHGEMVKAMQSTDNAVFPVWRRST